MAEQPPYAPNVVNQTVSYGGATWKGNPGTGWTQEGGGGGSGDLASSAAEMLKMYQEANKPAISSLQASIPEIQSKYAQTGQYLEGKVGTLDERYKNLLSEIKGQQTQETTRTATAQSREMGRRGISSESGYYDQAMNQVLNPINEFYTGQYNQARTSNEDALATLMNLIQGNTQSSVESQRAVQNAIANLQAGAGQSSIQSALALQQQQQTLAEAQRQRDADLAVAKLGQGTSTGDRYKVVGGNIFDTQTQQFIQGLKTGTGVTDGKTDYYNNPTKKTSGFIDLTPQQSLQQQYGQTSAITGAPMSRAY